MEVLERQTNKGTDGQINKNGEEKQKRDKG